MRTTLPLLCTLVLPLLFTLEVYCSFHDVTSKVGVSSVEGLVAAFGDFNGDKFTDLFLVTKQGKQLDVLLWNQDSQKFGGASSLVNFKTSVIVNVAPGDFNGDGCMDVLITTEAGKPDARNVQPMKVYVFWGNLDGLSKIEESFTLTDNLKDQPAILDVNGDLIPDFLGTIYNKDNTSLEERTYWISQGKSKTFLAQTQKANSKVKEENQALSPLRIPHSNGFLDLTGDMTADLFITSKNKEDYKFEIWENKGGILTYSPENIIGLPDGISAKSHVIGQSSFADFDGDGKIDHLLPVCSLPNCKESRIYLYINNKWSRILANGHDTWQFIPPSSNESITNIPLMTLRIGDYNMDGYPDGLIILDIITPTKIKRAPVLLQNVPCSDGPNCMNGRTFSMQWKSLMSLEGAVLATFFDLFENGITDFIIVTQTNDGKFKLHAVRNNLYVDASFVKVVVLSGATITSCKNEMPYGVNQAGPYVSYSVTDNDGKVKTGAAAQLSQSAYYALQCPYIVFGLGRTPNFVDTLTIGMPRAKDGTVRSHSWPSIIPNSQMIIIPYPPDQPNEWKSKLLVTPSKLVLLTALCLLGLCVVLALIIMVLHLLEKKADQKEKREDAHKFHFDAM